MNRKVTRRTIRRMVTGGEHISAATIPAAAEAIRRRLELPAECYHAVLENLEAEVAGERLALIDGLLVEPTIWQLERRRRQHERHFVGMTRPNARGNYRNNRPVHGRPTRDRQRLRRNRLPFSSVGY